MADIPQEVLDAYWQNMPSPYDQDMEDVEAAKRHIEAVSSAMFLAGKRAGMERAAEIAVGLSNSAIFGEVDREATCARIALAIRSENDG